MRKLGLVLVVAATMVAAGAAAASNPGWVMYRSHGKSPYIAFSHPPLWKARFAGYTTPPYGFPQYLIVALSTEPMHNPDCHYVQQPDGTTSRDCNQIQPDALPPGSVYATWWENASPDQPNSTLRGVPGNPTRVGGLLAKIVIDPTGPGPAGACPKGTTGSVQLYTATASKNRNLGEIYMYACTNTTNFPRFMSQLLPMVRSVHFRKST